METEYPIWKHFATGKVSTLVSRQRFQFGNNTNSMEFKLKNRIQELREMRSLSQEQLGKKIGIQKSGFNKIEKKDPRYLTVNYLVKIAQALDVTPWEIVYKENIEEDNTFIKSEISLLKNAVSMLMDIQERAFKEKLPKINVERD